MEKISSGRASLKQKYNGVYDMNLFIQSFLTKVFYHKNIFAKTHT